MTETAFERDIRAQGEVLGRVIRHYEGDGRTSLAQAWMLARAAPAVVFVAMGSSLSAAQPAAARVARRRPASAHEAGELLHYGLPAIADGSLVVLVSQSGRSVETVAAAERLRSRPGSRLVAVTNDGDSPLAKLADLVLPMLAGEEASVATRTFMTTFAALDVLGQALASDGPTAPGSISLPASLPGILDGITAQADLAQTEAAAFAACGSLSFVARGPALAGADYGALIMKETAALPAEALAGGSFRHGPMEIAGPGVGIVVLAPTGLTQALCTRVAVEMSELGSPTWLIGDDATALPSPTDRLRVTTLPAVDEAYAPLTMSVPIQRLAAALARQRGRVPGVLQWSRKVTDIE